MRGKVFVNVDKCVTCKRCKVACAVAHSQTGNLYTAIFEDPPPTPRIRLEIVGSGAVPVACRHCEGAPCMVVCPSGAINRCGPYDPVVIDNDACIGCRSCVIACPYGVPEMNQLRSTVAKCDLCEGLEEDSLPACVEACRTGALEFQTESQAVASVDEPLWQKRPVVD